MVSTAMEPVYFQTNPSDWNNLADSVLYSFAGKDVTEKTLNLQVNLMGEAVGYDRKFRLGYRIRKKRQLKQEYITER